MAKTEEQRQDVASEALENLVGQFSSKFDCFREMVQNSIDAGSGLIEIWTEFEPGTGGGGTAILHIDDDGQGMDRAIIDGQLTKLFSSKKEGDLTKIGKFGIGFVSIFALAPQAVLVHTGRGGEYWEVLFHEDRSFQLKALDEPTEGTQISLFLPATRPGYDEMVEQIRGALRHWCSHSETEILLEDRAAHGGNIETINEPFRVEGELMVRYEAPGTEIVAAYSTTPVYGFYNRGLALYLGNDGLGVLEERADRYAHISFKVKSHYLEHTLSRETVVRDENFHKAMQHLDSVADGPLLEALVVAMETLAKKERSSDEQALYERYAEILAKEPTSSFSRILERRFIVAHHSPPLSPKEALLAVGEADGIPGTILVSAETNALTEKAAQWVTTFFAPDTEATFLLRCLHAAHAEAQDALLARVFRREQRAPDTVRDLRNAFFLVEKAQKNDAQADLFRRAARLLQHLEIEGVTLVPSHTVANSPRSSKLPEFFSFRAENFAEPLDIVTSLRGRRVGVLLTQAIIQQLLRLAEKDPAQAAFVLAQRLVLSNLSDEPVALALLEGVLPEALND